MVSQLDSTIPRSAICCSPLFQLIHDVQASLLQNFLSQWFSIPGISLYGAVHLDKQFYWIVEKRRHCDYDCAN